MTNYTFKAINVPAATSTEAAGLDDSGDVVGEVTDAKGIHGFLDSNGTFTTFDFPNANQTEATSVNNNGEIVGTYRDSNNNPHGFVYNGGALTPLNYPGFSSTTEANGVNDSGEIVGQYGDPPGGFADVGGTFTSIAYPGATSTQVAHVDSAGDIAGAYQDAHDVYHGFVERGGAFTTIDFPGAETSSDHGTLATGINASGEVVGTYFDASGQLHGFVDNGGTFTSIDPLGSTSTAVTDVNAAGQLVGFETVNGVTSGFIATPVCFTTGTLIRTAHGDVPVEDLFVGDLAVTAAGVERPICWIGSRKIGSPACDARPVRILAGAFGCGLPERDLYLSPGHPVLVGAEDGEGGKLVPIMCLINGTTIARVPVDAVTYWHIELDAHDILLAEGLPAESYLDWGDRGFFSEGCDHALQNPDFVVPGLTGRCRPVATDGPVVEAERRRLDTVFAMRLAAPCAWPIEEDTRVDEIRRTKGS